MLQWVHYTEDPIGASLAALKSAREGTYHKLPHAERARQLRVLLVLSLQAATISETTGPLGYLSKSTYSGDNTRNAVGAAVARTALVLSPTKNVAISESMVSGDDFGPIPFPTPTPPDIDVAALPALAVVAIVSVAAAAACYCAKVIADAEHAISFEEEKTKRLLNKHAASISVIAEHVKREKLHGKILPFEKEETLVLNGLEEEQRMIMKDKHMPLPSPFDGAREFGLALAETTKKVGDTVTNTASLALPIAVGIGLWALAKK